MGLFDFLGGGGDQTVMQQPWRPAQSPLRGIISNAQNTYRSGGMDPYVARGIQTPALSGRTQSGMMNLSNAYNLGRVRDARGDAGRFGDAFGQGAMGFANTGGGVGPSMGMYRGMMDGGQTYRDFDKIREGVVDSTKAALGSTFGSGNMSGGLVAQEYGKGIGDALGRLEYDAYDRSQNRALQAGGMADAAFNAQQGRRMAGLGMIPQAQQALFAPHQMAGELISQQGKNNLVAGGLRDQYNTQVANERMQDAQALNDQDYNALQRYSSMMMGLGGMGEQQTQPGPSGLANALGGAATGLGTYGTLAGMGMAGPLGIAGGLAAGLGSIL